MKFRLCVVMAFAVVASAADISGTVTFNKDVLPILQKNCQGCHRPGNIAPMSFVTYEGTRPWAKAIKAAVLTHKMPPWFADPQYGDLHRLRFSGCTRVTPADEVIKWIDGARMKSPGDDEI